jgi:putative transposase
MKIFRAYKTELDPNNCQRTLLKKHAGAARWVYNWGLARKIESYKVTGKSISTADLDKELNHVKKDELPWLREMPAVVLQRALRHLDAAYCYFFSNVKAGKKPGFPKFKSKKRGTGSFGVCGVLPRYITATHIQLPKIGKIRLKEHGYLPVNNPKVHILGATAKERAGHWFVILKVEEEIADPVSLKEATGVDLGISSLATLHDGTKFENPKTLTKAQRKLKRMQRSVTRKQKGSQNRCKAIFKLAHAHKRIADVRSNTLHHVSAAITKRFGVVGLEDLNVEGMRKNHSLAQAVNDAGLSELRRQIEYKLAWKGGRTVKVDRFYPSTKRCSRCGVVKESMLLSERIFKCESCGLVLDRDTNAAENLRQVAVSCAETLNACGDGRLQEVRKDLQCLSGKQEPNADSQVQS